MIASAYLRIMQPLESLSGQRREAWERVLVRGEEPRRVYRQPFGSGRLGLLTVDEGPGVVRSFEGVWYVCPARTRLRVLASMLSLRELVPAEVADELVPEADARRAARELSRIRRRDPAAVPTMLQSAWHVPVRWFCLVADEERRIVRRPDGGYRLFYWTSVPAARERATRALSILRDNDLEVVAELVEDMVAWLSVFGERDAVELDYGEVSGLFDPADLEEDHSAGDLAASLDALARGDVERAGELYQDVAMRWAEAKTRESVN